MRTVVAAVIACLSLTACGVSTQDEPEPLGTQTTSGGAPTPVITQRKHSPPESTSVTPSTSTAATPTPSSSTPTPTPTPTPNDR